MLKNIPVFMILLLMLATGCGNSIKPFNAAALAGPESLFVRAGGIQFHYSKAGSGKTAVILLHGFGASVFTWGPVMKELASNYTVYAYDRVAFGITERPAVTNRAPGLNPYNNNLSPEHLLLLLDAWGIEKAWLAGHSAGCYTAVLFAMRYSHRVEGLILEAPAVFGGGVPPFVKAVFGFPLLSWLGPVFTRSAFSDATALLRLAYHDTNKIKPGEFEDYARSARVPGWENALWEFTLASEPYNISTNIPALSMPITVIYGDDDRIIKTELVDKAASLWTNADFHRLSNTGHIPHDESRDEYLRIVRELLPQDQR